MPRAHNQVMRASAKGWTTFILGPIFIISNDEIALPIGRPVGISTRISDVDIAAIKNHVWD